MIKAGVREDQGRYDNLDYDNDNDNDATRRVSPNEIV
jgi:hypothetical protein